MDNETKADVNMMIYDIVSMFGYWAKFPGSFKNLTQELLFSFFKDPENRHIKLLVMAIFVNEPRKIKSTDKTREKFKKTIKPLFFDPVKTKKKSNLVVIQKYGSCRSDSQFNLYITKNGYENTIWYLFDVYLL